MKARVFRYLAAGFNLVILVLAFALPYLAGMSMFSVGTSGMAAILSPEVQQHYAILSVGLWAMLLLPLACAVMWVLQQVPRWAVMLTQFVMLLVGLCVSVFLLLFANQLERSLTGVAWDVVTGLFGGESVLANYINVYFWLYLLLAFVALLMGAFAEQRYDDYDDEDVYEAVPATAAPAAAVPAAPAAKKREQTQKVGGKAEGKTEGKAAVVECRGGVFAGQQFAIRPGETLTFGRDPNECDVLFPADDLHVSRKHCVVALREVGHIYDVECTSSNGMMVGGEVCAAGQKKTVKKGTTIYVGDKENAFVLN
ncbi:MAG: FHA domain-containing protein [Oscillospiraceae bacterium]